MFIVSSLLRSHQGDNYKKPEAAKPSFQLSTAPAFLIAESVNVCILYILQGALEAIFGDGHPRPPLRHAPSGHRRRLLFLPLGA